MENGGGENNWENSGPLTSLTVDRLMATDCNTDRSCQFKISDRGNIPSISSYLGQEDGEKRPRQRQRGIVCALWKESKLTVTFK